MVVDEDNEAGPIAVDVVKDTLLVGEKSDDTDETKTEKIDRITALQDGIGMTDS